MVTIYKITNKINGKCYIGQSSNIKKRWWEHKRASYQPIIKSPLHKAFKKYGVTEFLFEILIGGLSREEANKKEIEFISLYKCNIPKYGYNITEGGLGHKGVTGVKHHLYGKKRIDLIELNKSRIGIKLSEGHKSKINPTGRIRSDNTKIKDSEQRKILWENGVYNKVNWKGVREKYLSTKSSDCNVKYNGETIPLFLLTAKLNLPYQPIWQRIKRHGWSDEEAINTPIRNRKKATINY